MKSMRIHDPEFQKNYDTTTTTQNITFFEKHMKHL